MSFLPRVVIVIIAICGFMGAGKSSFLNIYPEVSGIDLDKLIETRVGDLGDYIRTSGWQSFREAESESLNVALHELTTNGLISLGGGTLDKEENIELLKKSGVKILYLEIDFDTAMSRISGDGNRPQLDKTQDELRELFEKRSKIFNDVCDFKLVGNVDSWPTSFALLKSLI